MRASSLLWMKPRPSRTQHLAGGTRVRLICLVALAASTASYLYIVSGAACAKESSKQFCYLLKLGKAFGPITQRFGRRPTTTCSKRFVRYHASALEQSWSQEIAKLKSDDAFWSNGCRKVEADKLYYEEVIFGLQLHALKPYQDLSLFNLSSHEIVDDCTGATRQIYLEPLVSFLRHPQAICIFKESNGGILDKSYMLVPHAQEISAASNSVKWLFDAGASVYDDGAGGASQKWFVDTYRQRGIEFDRILCWEAEPTDAKLQWNRTPADIKRKMTWFNIPLNAAIGHEDNPFTFIKALTKVDDYVVFKLDIDMPAVEVALVQQLMNDPELLTLIDEFYFEHHVSGSPMQWHGWGDLRDSSLPLRSIEDSYAIFTFLRQKGVRAHAWV